MRTLCRAAFSLQDIPEGGDGITAISRSDRDQYLKQLVRDALWSDPADHDGLQASVRGTRFICCACGVSYYLCSMKVASVEFRYMFLYSLFCTLLCVTFAFMH